MITDRSLKNVFFNIKIEYKGRVLSGVSPSRGRILHCLPLSLVFKCRELSTQWMKFFDVDQTFIKLEVMDILVPESLHYLTNKKNPQLNRPKLDRVPQGRKFLTVWPDPVFYRPPLCFRPGRKQGGKVPDHEILQIYSKYLKKLSPCSTRSSLGRFSCGFFLFVR